jgi:hypothetical protein
LSIHGAKRIRDNDEFNSSEHEGANMKGFLEAQAAKAVSQNGGEHSEQSCLPAFGNPLCRR